ncbi:HAMP domain-containing sensor histidine kinase [Streptomyces sp. B1866]|uniref:sensor histidine kinase n=1 Tax=Streptomyces sp. B1866 TaxID=3075431 RepID=UPI00288F23C1|nr:HAMP domain-containing sensor histidine kinase [Streptomyces sp. B1866]MDT3397458.1 HAMP domain-containing sensor histidine kinase [Streptomyces sp. B1866]
MKRRAAARRGLLTACRGCARGRPHRHPTLRVKLTLSSITVLTVGIVVACALCTFAVQHYMRADIDEELTAARDALRHSGLSDRTVADPAEVAHLGGELRVRSGTTRTVFVSVGADGTARPLAGLPPDGVQRALAAAVPDAAALARGGALRDVTTLGTGYRVTAVDLAGQGVILLAVSTAPVEQTLHKAVYPVLGVGAVLVVLLGVATYRGAKRRLRPLEDMVETASAIAEGCAQGLNLSRRVAPTRLRPSGEVEQLRTALNAMLQQVETAFGAREHAAAHLRRFVADASHELRTPLAAIRGYLQLYEKGMYESEEERDRAMARVGAEAERMAHLVDELLALARLDQRPRLRPRPVDLAAAARDAAADLRAQQPGRPVELDLAEACLVLADETTPHQVVSNLLANVRTHTPADAAVRVSARREGGYGVLRVADRGPGLAPEDAERIFDRFFRAGTAAGSGLGMALVRAAAEAHGGSVRVTTAPGEGLTVTVALPAADGPEEHDALDRVDGAAGTGGVAGGAAVAGTEGPDRLGGTDGLGRAGAAEAAAVSPQARASRP